MRKKSDKCLLCKEKFSTKTNSHIVPKFLGKSMFKNGNIWKAYISTIEKNNFKEKKIQDTPKENFLFCPECENRIGILESYCSRDLISISKSNINNNYIEEKNNNENSYYELKVTNIVAFHLFVYSILWRLSISNHTVFLSFKLEPKKNEDLRKVLNNNLKATQLELLNYLNEKKGLNFKLHKFIIITSKNIDATRNFIFPNPGIKNHYYIMLNQFLLVFSFNNDKKENLMYKQLLNDSPHKMIKIIIAPKRIWIVGRERFKKFFK